MGLYAERWRVVKHSDVAIVGAGPAGLIAAEILARAGLHITVFERMPSPARKLLMAGRGGLNLTHSEPLETFISRYGEPHGVAQRALASFPPSALVDWANGLGAETFVGSSGRVFPKAMKASPLLRALLRRLADLGVEIKSRQTWTGFTADGTLEFTDTADAVQRLRPRATILALGGASWPRLGSDGSWVPILERAGVEITPLEAANCGISIAWSEHMAARYAGEPLKRVAVRVAGQTSTGGLVITRNGLEGGPVYALGPLIRSELKQHGQAHITLDLKPGVAEDEIANRLAGARAGQSQSNTLRKALALSPAAIALCRETGHLPTTPNALAHHLKAVPLAISGVAAIDRAISTAGGIAASALDDNLMLKTLPGVFAAGEMLDWDAPTGGYLLQASFATGVAAAKGVLNWLGSVETASRQPKTQEVPFS